MQREDQVQGGAPMEEAAAAEPQQQQQQLPPIVPMEMDDEDDDGNIIFDDEDDDIIYDGEQLTDEGDGDMDDDADDEGDVYLYLSESDDYWFTFLDRNNDTRAPYTSRMLCKLREMHQSRQKPDYAFQPLRLLKLNYKQYRTARQYPAARSGHRIIASGSNLYSLGGYNPLRSVTLVHRGRCLLFQELWCYNFAANRWKLILNASNTHHMPRELASNALVMHNNVLLTHGGTGFPFGESCSNDCYVYTTSDKPLVTRLKVTGTLPIAQYGSGIVVHNDYMYTIGGTTGFDYSCDVSRLSFKTKVWENLYNCRPEMRDDPEGRYRHEVVYDGLYIYVLGGGTSNTVYDLQRIPAFNLKTNRWEYFNTLPDLSMFSATPDDQVAGYPKPRKCFSCVQHKTSNGDIEAFITGGMQADAITYFADIWKLNLRTKQWSCIRTATLPHPLYFHAAAHAGNGCMYVFGGIEYSDKDLRRRNVLYKMWMTIPKLSEICWDALTYYNEHLNRYDRKTLIAAGIPERFLERLTPIHTYKHVRSTQSQFASALLSRLPRSQSE